MVTSASDRETVAEAIKLGAAGFIVKPFQADKVQAKIRETLGAELAAKFEDPAVAIKRLGISAARYVTYLEALAGQIDSAILKAEGGGSGTALGKQGLDALHTGCLTLGATYCAAVINADARTRPGTFNIRPGQWRGYLRDRAALQLEAVERNGRREGRQLTSG